MEELVYNFTRKEKRDYAIRNGLLKKKKVSLFRYKKQLILISVALIVFLLTLIFAISSVKASDKSTSRVKSFISVRVFCGDTVWSIAEENLSPEYSSVSELVNEIEKTNHLVNGRINSGNYIIVPVFVDAAELVAES